jgi:hypothetical protein
MTDFYVLMMESWINNQLDDMKDYIIENEKYFESESVKIRASHAKFIDDSRIEYDNDYIEQLAVEYKKYSDNFPTIFRKSVLICLYSLLENCLFSICEMERNRKGYEISYVEIEGKGIIKAQKYLKFICKIDVSHNSKYWQTIKEYNILRNVFVHNEGKVKNEKRLNHFLRINSEYIKSDSDGYLQMKKGLLEYLQKNVQLLLIEIFAKIQN